MKCNQYKIHSKVWLYPGPPAGGGSWHFVSIPKGISEDIKNQFGDIKRGWGSLPAMVTAGKTGWKTSIFPDKKAGGYLLPIKAEVRKKEGIVADHQATLLLEIRV